jgi:phosphoribosyl 1,2-cyclic phosphate phosphodiesterase
MSGVLEFTVLGSGSSGGVPRADGNWGVCDPANPKNRRSRCSLLVRRRGEGAENETTVVVDTSPELRLQTAAAGARRIDAVLYTHDHADQVHGIDDLRAFYLRWKRRTPCYMDQATATGLMRRFGYIFEGHGGYPAICEPVALPEHGVEWAIDGPSGAIPVVSFDQDHGEIRAAGFRFGDVAYSPDVLDLPDAAFAALQGVKVWIVDALRDAPHPTHAHVDKTLAWIAAVRPERAILTNLHIDLDYDTLSRRLPPGVEPAYDGLRFETPI